MEMKKQKIVQDLEDENVNCKWYHEQLEEVTNKVEQLPVTDNYNLQTDMARRQLDFEAQRIRDLMQENYGTTEHISQRHEARLQRIRMIETEMLRIQRLHKAQQMALQKQSEEQTEAKHDDVLVVDAATSTIDSQKMAAKECNDSRATFHPPNGTRHNNLSSQSPVIDEQKQNNQNLASLYHGAWPMEKGVSGEGSLSGVLNQETSSVMSFNSSNASTGSRRANQQQLGTKVEMVYSLLSMLGTHDKDDMSRTLLAMSSSQDSCIAMRQSGCLPLLIQLLHGNDKESGLLGNTRGSKAARARAAAALHNIVHSHPDDKRGRREARVLRLLEQIRAHCDQLRDVTEDEEEGQRSRPGSAARSADIDHHPGPAIAALMKLSFDEEHRHAICTLGGLQAIAELLYVDHEAHHSTTEQYNITMRRYACMALTNLTFGDGTNKALLCSMKLCMHALVAQLESPNEDLRQVAASVLRNLSWRADLASKKTLREVGAVTALMKAALEVQKESTLKSVLSALWNLSAHCSENKADICAVDGALAFLVSTLTYKSPSKTLAIIENGGGMLRNVSSHIAVREDYRKILRTQGCMHILLKHLRSPSLTIVSNACGTLWNLSARCTEDQQALWEMGAVSMLRNLVHSKHKMISMGSAAALKNLLGAKPAVGNIDGDKHSRSNMPSLTVRKYKQLESELDQNLSETCDNIESPRDSPQEVRKHPPPNNRFMYQGDSCGMYQVADSEHRRPLLRSPIYSRGSSGENSPLLDNRLRSPQRPVARTGSQDSVGSTHSDISHDRVRVSNMLTKSKLSQDKPTTPERKLSQRNNDNFRGSSSPIDPKSNILAPNSRIMQIMQEVVMHAETTDKGGREPHTTASAPASPKTQVRPMGRGRSIPVYNRQQPDPAYKGTNSAHASPVINHRQFGGENRLNNIANYQKSQFSNLPQKVENLKLTDADQEQPINYSLKYSDNQKQDNFKRPLPPKVGNYVAGLAFNSGQQKNSNAPQGKQTKPPRQNHGYAETDLDSVDQPTNYGMRYTEEDEEVQFTEQPINYSTRYRDNENCADCKLHMARRTNDIIDEHICDDQVKAFYTEDTPYLSTATSLTDLSKHKHGDDHGGDDSNSPPSDEQPQNYANKYPESEDRSTNGSQSTCEHSRSTVIHVAKPQPPRSVQEPTEMENAPPMNMRSYIDTNDMLPPEKPKTYAEEGTPLCFSRVSSLSSLHSSEAQDRGNSKPPHDPALQSIAEGKIIDTTDRHNRSQGENPANISQGAESTASGPAKSVTFDEHNNIQETPMMFSRCSSLGSLSSFDAHSVHSSVISEYSRRASEVVSPSDLPDSPSDTVPNTPKRSKSPVKFPELGNSPNKDVATPVVNPHQREAQSLSPTKMGPPLHPPLKPNVNQSRGIEPEKFTRDPQHFSTTSSLSALSFDDDEPKIQKDNDLATIPLTGERGDMFKMEQATPKPKNDKPFEPVYGTVTKEDTDTSKPNDLDEGSSVSEVSDGDEDILAACISSAMPSKSSKSKMRKSHSDHSIKKTRGNPQRSGFGSKIHGVRRSASGSLSPRSKLPPNFPAGKYPIKPIPDPWGSIDEIQTFAEEGTPLHLSGSQSPTELVPPVEAPAMRQQQIQPQQNIVNSKPDTMRFKNPEPHMVHTSHNFNPGHVQSNISSHGDSSGDTLKNFAVEDTPHNFSTATSLSDLSFTPDGGDSMKNDDERALAEHVKNNDAEDSHKGDPSDMSSLDDDEDLLSELIDSAMPKSIKKKSHGSTQEKTEANESKNLATKQQHGSVFKKGFQPLRTSSERSDAHIGASDSVRTYAVEGTPANLSTATSLSNLTVDDYNSKSYGEPFSTSDHPSTEPNMHSTAATFGSIPQEDDVFLGVSSCYDSPKVYGVEGTPFSFSRNDSLSSLDCEDDAETGSVNRHKMTPRKQGPLKKLSIPQSPRQVEGSSGGSTPHSKAILSKPPIPSSSKTKSDMPPNVAKDIAAARKISGDDISKNYEVEGTPMCFSRNSSLSSLNSEDMVAKAKSPEGIPVKDDNESFVLEDTPLSFSRNSSLSSLSINSVDSEPSASEQALLDECINSAMPKKTPSKVDKSKSKSKTSPGASATKTKTPPGKSTKSKPAVKTLPAKQPSQPINQQPQPAKQSSQPVKQPSQPFKQPPQPAAKPNVSHRSRNPQSRSASRQISDSNSNVIPTGSNNNHITNPSSRANNNADNNRDESLNCFNPMMQTDTNANLSSWRKMPHKSSEDFRVSKNTAEGNTSSWRRTRSQDGDLKQRKEATNQEKAQESTAMIWKKMPELHLVNNVITVANVSATLAQIDSNKSSPSCSTKTHETLQYPDNKLSEMHLNDAGHESGTEKMDSCKENDSDESEHDKPEHDDAIEALRDADRSIQQFQPEVFCPLQDPDPEDNSEPLGLGPFQDKSPFQDRGKNIICDSRTKISLDSPDDPDGIVLEDEVDINDTLDSIEIIDMDDIMQETFPDDFPMANSGGSIIPAHPDTDSSKDDQSEKLSQDDVTTTDQSEKLPFDDVTNTTSIDQPIEVPHIEPHDLSVEDERLLEENANLVLSELTTQHLEGSVNDDLFIDNETLSLVSNDFTDDNASEISLSLSASSKTLSETTTASDVTSTVAQPSTARPRPRIIKPTDKEYIERKAAEEQKGIRGAKKNYRGVKSFSSASSVKSSVSSKSSVSLTSKNQKPVTPIRGGNKPTTNGPKAVTPRKPIASKTSQNGKSTPLKGNAGTSKAMSTPTKGTSAPAKGTPSPPKGTNNTQPTNYGTYTKNGPKGTQKSKVTTQKPTATPDVKPVNSKQSDPSDRPKPPIKQGTFTKDTASTNSALPTISSNRSAESECDDESVRFSLDVDNDATEYSFNQDDDDLTDLSIPGVILRKKRLSGGSHGSSGSVRHSSSSPRNSSGSTSSGDKFTPPTSWTNTLEGNFHFVVDTSQQQGYDAPYKQIQMKRHASDAPPALKKQVSNESNKTMNDLNKPTRQTTKVTPGTNLTKTASGNSLSKSGGTVTKTSSGSSLSAKSAASKTSGVTNLKKTSSGGSLSKGSPGSGIPKTPSGSNLNKTNTGSAMSKTSTSAGNLRKTSSGSNLTKNSPGSSISKTSSGGNLTKTTSGTSIAKRGSDGSLSSRNGSNGSVNKPLISPRETKTSALRNGAKSNLQKSESNTSLKKAAGPSKTTPASPRRGSNTSIASTPSTTPTKPGAKKPVTSKISGLWKREDGKSVVPVANNSRTASPSGKPPTPTKSQKPEVKIQNTTQNKIGSKSPKQIRKVAPPTKVNLPANKVKPLTPPRKSSAVSPVQKSSPVDAPSEGIKRSSTYDKLSPEKEPEVTQPKASGGWRKAPNNVSDSDSDCTPKPTSGIKKPVGAFRRAVDLQGSDSDSSGSEKPMRKSGQIWVKRGSNPPPPPPRTSSRLRSSAPPRTMDNNTKQTLLDTEDVAKRRLTYTVPDDTAMPDAPDSTARPMQHVDVVVNVKNCITVNGGLNNGPVTTTSSTTVTSPTKADITNKVSPSAVVQPYNYTPTQKTTKTLPTQKSSSIQKPSNKKPEKIDTDVNEGSDSEKGLKREMTKTEMLIARRRRSYLNSNKSDESIDSDEKKRNCLVTTV